MSNPIEEEVEKAKKELDNLPKVDPMEDPRYAKHIPQAMALLQFAQSLGKLKKTYPAYGIGVLTKDTPEDTEEKDKKYRITHEPSPRVHTMLEVLPLNFQQHREIFIFRFEQNKAPVRIYKWDNEDPSWKSFEDPVAAEAEKEKPPTDQTEGDSSPTTVA